MNHFDEKSKCCTSHEAPKCNKVTYDYGPEPFSANIVTLAEQNELFRRALWTGCYLQATLMCIPVCGEIGLEMHPDTDQFLFCVEGQGIISMSSCKDYVEYQKNICKGDGIFIPTCKWHNIINTGKCPLKLYSIYAPPHHPHGTMHKTKADAEKKCNS